MERLEISSVTECGCEVQESTSAEECCTEGMTLNTEEMNLKLLWMSDTIES